MRKFTLIGLLMGLMLPCGAQTSKELLTAFAAKIKEAAAVEASFSMGTQAKGKMILQEDCFYLEADEFRIYCNGTKKWVESLGMEQVDEVPHDSKSVDVLENPPSFFYRLHTDYTTSKQPKAATTATGNAVWEMTLIPKKAVSESFAFIKASLTLKAADLTPIQIQYWTADMQTTIIVINDFQWRQTAYPKTTFEP